MELSCLKDYLKEDFWIMPATPKYKDSGIPYITSKNIKNGKIDFSNVNYISEEDYSSISKNRPIKKGDILISMIGTLGETAIVTEDDGNFYGQNMFLVRLNENKIDKEFFLHYFKSIFVKRQLEKNKNKSTQGYLKANHIENLIIPNIDLNSQRIISKRLNVVDKLINNKKNQIDLLNMLVKSKFVEMFDNKNYPKSPGKELFSFSSGKFLEESKRKQIGIPVYGGNGIAWYTDQPLINYSTIVFGRVGAYCGNVKIVEEPVWITDNAIYIKEFKKNVFDLNYLYNMLKFIDFSRYAQHSGQPKITQKPLEEYNYMIPPIEEQRKFSNFIKKVNKQKLEFEESLKKLEELQSALMQEYF